MFLLGLLAGQFESASVALESFDVQMPRLDVASKVVFGSENRITSGVGALMTLQV